MRLFRVLGGTGGTKGSEISGYQDLKLLSLKDRFLRQMTGIA